VEAGILSRWSASRSPRSDSARLLPSKSWPTIIDHRERHPLRRWQELAALAGALSGLLDLRSSSSYSTRVPTTLPARSLAVSDGASFVVSLPPSKPRNQAGRCSQLKIWNPNEIPSDRREQHSGSCTSIRSNAKRKERSPRYAGSPCAAMWKQSALHWFAGGLT
jgi:hypothetical protein